MTPALPLAIYRRPGRFVVSRYTDGAGLWAILGSDYTLERAREVAAGLTADMPRRTAKCSRGKNALGGESISL